MRIENITFDDRTDHVTVDFAGHFGAASFKEWKMSLSFSFRTSESDDFREDQHRALEEAMAILLSLRETPRLK